MSALVYDCDETIEAAVERLKAQGARDGEILLALISAAVRVDPSINQRGQNDEESACPPVLCCVFE